MMLETITEKLSEMKQRGIAFLEDHNILIDPAWTPEEEKLLREQAERKESYNRQVNVNPASLEGTTKGIFSRMNSSLKRKVGVGILSLSTLFGGNAFAGNSFEPSVTVDHTIYHVAGIDYWNTYFETVNVDSEPIHIRLDAYGVDGKLGESEMFTVNGQGTLRTTLEDAFANLYQTIGPKDIKSVKVMSDKHMPGKLFTSTEYEFGSKNELDGVTFQKEEAYHKLFLDHVIPDYQMDVWWEGLKIANVSGEAIDLYFIDGNGEAHQLIENDDNEFLNVGDSLDAFLLRNLIGQDYDFSTGFFEAYKTGSSLVDGEVVGEKVDALAGLMVFGWRNGSFGVGEGISLKGETVDGRNNYASEFYFNMGSLQHSKLLNHDFANDWYGITYGNPSSETQIVTFNQYDNDGNLLKSIDKTMLPFSKIAFVPEKEGFDSSLEGMLEIVSSGKGTSIFLQGDLDRSFMGGGNTPCSNDKSKYLEVPITYDNIKSGVLSIMNPNDEAVMISVQLNDTEGNNIYGGVNNLVITAKGSTNLDLTDEEMLTTYFNGKLRIMSDLGVVASYSEYTNNTSPDQKNMAGKQVLATNGPNNEVVIDELFVSGNVFENVNSVDNLVLDLEKEQEFALSPRILRGIDGIKGINWYLNNQLVQSSDDPGVEDPATYKKQFDQATEFDIRAEVLLDDENSILDVAANFKGVVSTGMREIDPTVYKRFGEGDPLPVGVSGLEAGLEQNDSVSVYIHNYVDVDCDTINMVLGDTVYTAPVVNGEVLIEGTSKLSDNNNYSRMITYVKNGSTVKQDTETLWSNVPAEQNYVRSYEVFKEAVANDREALLDIYEGKIVNGVVRDRATASSWMDEVVDGISTPPTNVEINDVLEGDAYTNFIDWGYIGGQHTKWEGFSEKEMLAHRNIMNKYQTE